MITSCSLLRFHAYDLNIIFLLLYFLVLLSGLFKSSLQLSILIIQKFSEIFKFQKSYVFGGRAIKFTTRRVQFHRACSFNHAHPTWIQRLVTEVAYADLCLAYSFCPSTAAFCGVSPLLSTTRAPIVLVTFNACLSMDLTLRSVNRTSVLYLPFAIDMVGLRGFKPLKPTTQCKSILSQGNPMKCPALLPIHFTGETDSMLMRGLWVIVPLSTTYRVLLPKPFKCGTTAQEEHLVLVPSAPFITRRGLEVGGPLQRPNAP